MRHLIECFGEIKRKNVVDLMFRLCPSCIVYYAKQLNGGTEALTKVMLVIT